jgi:alcohol dehydrogenase
MRQLEITGARSVQWREAPAPTLQGDGEALVRPLAVALCDLDAVFLSGAVPIAEPFALGHECVAEVLEVGDAVTTVVPGDRVVVPFQISLLEMYKRGCTLHTGRVHARAEPPTKLILVP